MRVAGSLPDIQENGNPSFQILRANWHDLGDLQKLEQICFPEDAWPIWDLIAVLTLPKIVRLKAAMEGKFIGFVAGDPQPRENLGWISTLGVLPEYRRLGIAQALLSECEGILGSPRIRLSVRRSNETAIMLYYKTGYRMIDVWRGYYHNGEDALILEKRR